MEISTAIQDKAIRLVEQGRVIHVKGLAYEVQGDSDTYTVHLSYPDEVTGACNCKSALPVCSHLLAATITYQVQRPVILVPATDPFEGII